MSKLIPLLLLFSFAVSAQDKGGHHVMLLNGGHDVNSNYPRYYENIKSMYDAYRSNGVDSKDISVLYGSGYVEDTYTPLLAVKPMGLIIPPSVKTPEIPKTIPLPKLNSTDEQAPTPRRLSDSPYSPKDLFSGEERGIDGEAKISKIKEKIAELKSKLRPGDDLSLFITDHGDLNEEKNENSVNLWGEEISTLELGKILNEIPETTNIRIITNICYGGGLNELTSKNICVFANQEKETPSSSESTDLDLYGQNFAFALKNKLDFDNDGKSTYLDAHEYAISLDNKANVPVTSLDWFLHKNEKRIQQQKEEAEKNAPLFCEQPSDESLKSLSRLIQDFDQLKKSLEIVEDIPIGREHLVSPRLRKKLSLLKNAEQLTRNDSIEIKLNILKKTLSEAALQWDTLSEEQQKLQRKKAELEAQQLKGQIQELKSLQSTFRSASVELDLIRYGDKAIISEYENIRRCLEYEY